MIERAGFVQLYEAAQQSTGLKAEELAAEQSFQTMIKDREVQLMEENLRKKEAALLNAQAVQAEAGVGILPDVARAARRCWRSATTSGRRTPTRKGFP